ncbi:acetylglutamate kinase [Hymenobacter qilianensis]|uniref:Acetylglutamate kinase n=2 Tax=Hymenobacter qilianensis TaxID=1385715 RepID=A0ACB5PL79_9BACT|nr:acetylglutamate kinase [Hymenobacter qilianensis]QNP50897.1 acetylglutamate kinase [Hymenobacter qilianensis]GGF49703.1 acetylglutamate kinase [Hymenobacter qilianensis]
MSEVLKIFKIGGGIIDDTAQLSFFLSELARVGGKKIVVHGGGKGANELLTTLGMLPNMVNGRRITDAATLDVVTMFYAGKTNKQIVALLQQVGVNALGLSGADGNVIRAIKRPVGEIDYGFVGDLPEQSINTELIQLLLEGNLTPVFCAITHDGHGQLLNTNADTIASTLARALAHFYQVELHFCFEKDGVLADVNDESSVIPQITPSLYTDLKASGAIAAGMLPKLENAFAALEAGVAKVIIENALKINKPVKTILCRD